MINQVAEFLRQECGLSINKPVLVGVSGGPDSLCLLDVLAHLEYPLVVAHLNHQFRPEADLEAGKVEAYAREHKLVFVGAVENVPRLAREWHMSDEEAARMVRYRFLFEQARRYHCQAVAVGHTLDDQTETVLMHLIRGSGLKGLTGISPITRVSEWDKEIPIIRPLLAVSRAETQKYCTENGLTPSYDSSNEDVAYLRNKIRLQLVPELAAYNPRIREALWRTARVLAGDEELLEAYTAETWDRLVVSRGASHVSMDRMGFIQQPVGAQRRLIRKCYDFLKPGLRELDFITVEKVLDASLGAAKDAPVNISRPMKVDVVGGVRLEVSADQICLRQAAEPIYRDDSFPQVSSPAGLSLDRMGDFPLGPGWTIEVQFRPLEEAEKIAERDLTDSYQAWLDAEKLSLPLVVRVRKPGDRFSPLGMPGHTIKLSDFMVNEKIPQVCRKNWPLVCRGNEIVWVIGYRPSESCRITPTTRQICHLRVIKSTSP